MCTYSDLDKNTHLRILLVELFPLVPFECTVLSWFIPSQQRGAFGRQSNGQSAYTFHDSVSRQLLDEASLFFEIHVKMYGRRRPCEQNQSRQRE